MIKFNRSNIVNNIESDEDIESDDDIEIGDDIET